MYSDDILNPNEQIEFPWLVFKLNKSLYTVNSKIITTIVMVPEHITTVPNVPDYMLGLIHLRGNVIPLLDLRLLFNMKSIKSECSEFENIIDKVKSDYVTWIEEIENSLENNEIYKMNEDYMECSFAKWCDSFKQGLENGGLHMDGMMEFHKNIYQKAFEAVDSIRVSDDLEKQQSMKNAFKEAKEENMPYLLDLLEETKEIFKMRFKEMVIVLEDDNSCIGIIVDEVLSVQNIISFETTEEISKMCKDKYVCGVAKSDKNDDVLLILDSEKIMNVK